MSAPSRAALTTRGQKLSWLLAHQDLWEGLPMASLPADQRSPEQRQRLYNLARLARSEGLYSPKTCLWDISSLLLWIINDYRVNRLRPEPLAASAQEPRP